MFHIQKSHYYKNPFIGLFLKTNDAHTLMPRRAPPTLTHAADALKTEKIELLINQSPLVGLFCLLNSNGCILPHESEPAEKKILKKAGYNVHVLKSPLAPGNMMLTNDHAVFCSMEVLTKEAEKIGETLGVEVFRQPLSGMHTPGSLNVVTNSGFFAYNEITEVDYEQFKAIFKVNGQNGTANNGTVFNALGVVANRHGALIGEATTGFETQRVYEALRGK